MIEAGVPVVPGSPDALKDVEEARVEAERIGYPVIIKAAAGGGGKGMRSPSRQTSSRRRSRWPATRRRRLSTMPACTWNTSFSVRDTSRFRFWGDTHGNLIHLGERDCSIQRRHQKLIEESPSPGITPEIRRAMGGAAIRAGRAIGYSNAGTVEFLLTESGEFYFMEMNTRIQVEHPVTRWLPGWIS